MWYSEGCAVEADGKPLGSYPREASSILATAICRTRADHILSGVAGLLRGVGACTGRLCAARAIVATEGSVVRAARLRTTVRRREFG